MHTTHIFITQALNTHAHSTCTQYTRAGTHTHTYTNYIYTYAYVYLHAQYTCCPH